MREKVAIYLRKSREDTNSSIQETLQNHRSQLLDLANRNNFNYEIYEEIGSSESIASRQELQRLLADLEEGKYKKLLVVALDRLSRNELDSAYIFELLRSYDIEVYTPNKIYNFNEESDIMLSDFEKLIARSEMRLIKKRNRQAKITKNKAGKWVNGSPSYPYFYNSNTKEIEVDEAKHEVYKYIIDRVKEGYSIQSLAVDLNKKGISSPKGKEWRNWTVYRIVTSRVPLGYVNFAGVESKGTHKAIITEDEYNEILSILKLRGSVAKKSSSQNIYSLTSLVKCSKCGSSHTTITKNGYPYLKKCWYVDGLGNKCDNSGMKLELLEEIILDDMSTQAELLREDINTRNNKSFKIELDKLKNELKLLNNQIEKIDKKKLKVKEMILNDIYTIEEGKYKNIELDNERLNIETHIRLVQGKIKSMNTKVLENRLNSLECVINALNDVSKVSPETRNELYRSVISKVVYRREKNNIEIEVTYV